MGKSNGEWGSQFLPHSIYIHPKELSMSFDLKHLPRCFGDLVIADPLNASVICSYCELPPAKPLLLAGPPGAGKTEAARVIAHSYFEQRNIQHMHWEFNAASLVKDYEAKIMSEVNYQMFGNSDKALIVINEIDEMDLRSVQPKFREFMDTKRHLIHFVATTNHKSRIMGAVLSRFRALDLDPPTSVDWVDRAKAILEAEGLTPTRADVVQMLQSFQGSARDLIDLLEETVITSKAFAP
jgi:DNA polymerase III delta prime subunit